MILNLQLQLKILIIIIPKLKNLIYIVNYGEAKRLTSETDVIKAGRKLLHKKYVVGAIIKYNSRGAFVFTSNKSTFIPSFETKNVWLIGSGDIFSAVFFYYWVKENLSVIESARKASYYTAFYCETKILPLPKKITEEYNFKPIPSKIKSTKLSGQIYLAGGFFSLTQFWLIQEIRNIFLNKKLKVFSPYH